MEERVESYPVLPNSVYVWRGYKSPQHSYADFINFLGTIFVPACALLQPKVGLRAYIPSLIPQSSTPSNLPDQTALMFWDTPNSHNLANGCLAVRVYQNLHGDLYDMVKSKLPEIPTQLPSEYTSFTTEQPYYLFEIMADWMNGQTRHFVAERPENIDETTFLTNIFNWCTNFKIQKLSGVDACIVCCGKDYVAIWVHSYINETDLNDIFKDLLGWLSAKLNSKASDYSIQKNLWSSWAGIDLSQSQNTCINIQLDRPIDTKLH